MLKVNFGMQEVNNFKIGIGIFANRLIMDLMKYDDLDCSGHVFLTWHTKKQDYQRFNFQTKISLLPAKFIYDAQRRLLPLSMRQICHTKSDVYVYFNYKIPRVHFDEKVITTIHDLIPMKTEMESTVVKSRYLSSVKDAIARSDEILTVSEYSRKDILSYFNISPDRVHVIPNGVDFLQFNTPIDKVHLEAVRKKYALPESFILYFGSARKHKNIPTILKAYAQIPKTLRESVHLVITNGNDQLRKLAEELDITKYVRFTGIVQASDKAAFYQMAMLKIFISLYEGFGIPVLEAMAAGTPVIASNVSSLPEVCADAAVLVDPHDIDQISEAMVKVLTHVEFRKELISRGLMNAKGYSWSSASCKLHDLLMRIAP